MEDIETETTIKKEEQENHLKNKILAKIEQTFFEKQGDIDLPFQSDVSEQYSHRSLSKNHSKNKITPPKNIKSPQIDPNGIWIEEDTFPKPVHGSPDEGYTKKSKFGYKNQTYINGGGGKMSLKCLANIRCVAPQTGIHRAIANANKKKKQRCSNYSDEESSSNSSDESDAEQSSSESYSNCSDDEGFDPKIINLFYEDSEKSFEGDSQQEIQRMSFDSREYSWEDVNSTQTSQEKVNHWQIITTRLFKNEQKIKESLKKPEKFFQNFFPDVFFMKLSLELNNFLKDCHSIPNLKIEIINFFKSVKEFTRLEIKKYVAILFYMGLVRLPDISHYWIPCKPLNNHFIRELLTKTRFFEISITMDYYKDQSEFLSKIVNMSEFFQEIWLLNYLGGETLTLTQVFFPFKMKSNLIEEKVFNYGSKIYSLVDSSSGYVIKWSIHPCGKGSENVSPNEIVLKLMQGFENKGINLFCSEKFTNDLLLKELEKMNISLTGKIKEPFGVGLEQQINDTKQTVIKKCDNMYLTLWVNNNKKNFFLSNLVGPTFTDNFGGFSKMKPLVAEIYEETIKRADLIFEKMAFSINNEQNKKMNKCLFHSLLETTFNNMYIVYQMAQSELKNGKSYAMFKYEFINYLIYPNVAFFGKNPVSTKKNHGNGHKKEFEYRERSPLPSYYKQRGWSPSIRNGKGKGMDMEMPKKKRKIY